jgi:Ca2+-binding EF-hand superfamily protein
LLKRDFLVASNIGEEPFPIGALNLLGVEEKVDFVDFFATLYIYCTLDHEKLTAFTFKFANKDGSGYLSLEELDTLVRPLQQSLCNLRIKLKLPNLKQDS